MSRLSINLKISGLDGHNPVETTALVDTGSTFLCLPQNLIDPLGVKVDERLIELADGTRRLVPLFGGLLVEVEGFGRTTSVVVPLPVGAEALLGYTALEELGIVVDMARHRLTKVAADLKAVTGVSS